MCGIAGIVKRTGRSISDQDRQAVETMLKLLHHRGPDVQGRWTSPQGACLFGHARLSIIDIAGSPQPMLHKSATVTYNGELYNYQELRRELQARGRSFETTGDTEILLQSLCEWDVNALDRLDGMFAAGFWENSSEQLLLLRDPFGIKPLYFAITDDALVFASELTALRVAPGVDREIAHDALVEFLLYGYIPSPKSILRGVHKLPPGHWLRYDRKADRVEIKRYWTPQFQVDSSLTEAAAVEMVDDALRQSVRSHLASDVPVGAFLSGGIDSSLVVSYMVEHGNRKAFTAEFEEAGYNEATHAETIARHIGVELTRCPIQISDGIALSATLAKVYDEPFADSSALPTYLVCQSIHKNVTVVLSGDGGDEVFGGYKRYQEFLRYQSLAGGREAVRALWNPFQQLFSDESPIRQRMEELAGEVPEHYQRSLGIFSTVHLGVLLRDRELARTNVRRALIADCLRDETHRAPDPVTAAQLCDILTYLPEDNLTKVDRASMAHSLEVRVPFLSRKVWAAAMRLPSSLRVLEAEGRNKVTLRALAARRLPQSISTLPKKGFSIPATEWFRGSLMGRFREIADGSPLLKQYFNAAAIEKLAQEHLTGKHRHHQRLWALMMLGLWYENHASAISGLPAPR